MSKEEFNSEIKNLISDMSAIVFTHGSSNNCLLWDEVQIAINNHKKALDTRRSDKELVTALEKILSHAEAGSKGVSLMYAAIKMEAEDALARYKEKPESENKQ